MSILRTLVQQLEHRLIVGRRQYDCGKTSANGGLLYDAQCSIFTADCRPDHATLRQECAAGTASPLLLPPPPSLLLPPPLLPPPC
jgi:hypothetical protein